MQCIDIHTHQQYNDDTIAVYNAFLEDAFLPLHYSWGIHPCYITENLDTQLVLLERLVAENPGVTLIGECGLDKICDIPWEQQQAAFVYQMQLAAQYQKPLIIHCVRAYQECLKLLEGVSVPVIFHGFNKHVVLAQQIVQSGHYISIGSGVLQHPEKYSALLESVPLHHIFLETDDRPVHVREVYHMIAEVLKIGIDDVILQVQKNLNNILYQSNGRY